LFFFFFFFEPTLGLLNSKTALSLSKVRQGATKKRERKKDRDKKNNRLILSRILHKDKSTYKQQQTSKRRTRKANAIHRVVFSLGYVRAEHG